MSWFLYVSKPSKEKLPDPFADALPDHQVRHFGTQVGIRCEDEAEAQREEVRMKALGYETVIGQVFSLDLWGPRHSGPQEY